LYSEEKIKEVLASANLAEIIGERVPLNQVGPDSYKGLCPFHEEKTPSFYVTPSKGLFHCFGCRAGGNAINFLMKINNQNFVDALKELARRVGVKLEDKGEGEGNTRKIDKTRLYSAMEMAANYFQERLWSEAGSQTVEYLFGERGLSRELAIKYRLGLALNLWDGLLAYLKNKGVAETDMAEAGLVRLRREGDGYYDVFRNRLMIPVLDPDNRVVAFAGRTLPWETNKDAPKYINSPTTEIYKKGQYLYGFSQARPFMKRDGLAFLVEGYFDLLSLAKADVKNAVAVMGTALTEAQIKLLKSQVSEVILLFDGDEAGQKAASAALPAILDAELEGKVIVLKNNEDPDVYIRNNGEDGLFELADKAPTVLEYVCELLAPKEDASLSAESRAIREAQEILAKVRNLGKRDLLGRKLAERLKIKPEHLSPAESLTARPRPSLAPKTSPARQAIPSAREILALVFAYPELAGGLSELKPHWPKDDSRKVFEELLRQFEERGNIVPESLIFEDDGEMGSLVAEASFAPKTLEARKEAAFSFEALGKNLITQAIKARHGEISQAIEAAQLAGDSETVDQLLLEKKKLPPPLLARMRQ
jgi:DNA primase